MKRDRRFSIFLFIILPTCAISRLFGFLARMTLPGFILRPVIKWYSKKFGVRSDEIAAGQNFRSLEQFFTRSIKEEARPIGAGRKAIISPVDARIDQFGEIRGSSLMQAKGRYYSLDELIPSASHAHFARGAFITLYLSPGDYHRIHSPVSGMIAGYFAIPGRLFTVQDYMVRGMQGLFAGNERVITYIESAFGLVGVCMVGAMNVGRISLSYCDVVTNRALRRRSEYFYPSGRRPSSSPPSDRRPAVGKGDELGVFHLGSTVILLFQENSIHFENLTVGQRVRMGQTIARFL